MGLPKTLRGWALAAFAGVWSLFVGVVVVGFLTAWATQHHWFDNPDKTVSHVAAWLWSVATNPVCAWAISLLLGITAGFAGGVWLDAFLRRKEVGAVSAVPAIAVVSLPPNPGLPSGALGVDWGPWKLRSKFTLEQFSKILVGINPTGFANSSSHAYCAVLIEQMEAGRLRNANGMRLTLAHPDSTVSKSDALSWALAHKIPLPHITG